jgi:hypothetical protein
MTRSSTASISAGFHSAAPRMRASRMKAGAPDMSQIAW